MKINDFFDNEIKKFKRETQREIYFAGSQLQSRTKLYIPQLKVAESVKVYNFPEPPTSYVRILRPNDVKLTSETDAQLLRRLPPAERAGLPRIYSQRDWVLVQRKMGRMRTYTRDGVRTYYGTINSRSYPLYQTKPNVPIIPFFDIAEQLANQIPYKI